MNYHITLQSNIRSKWVNEEGNITGEPSRVASFVSEFDRDICLEALVEVYPRNNYDFKPVDES